MNLAAQQAAATDLYDKGKYAEALSAFTVLRKLRARQDGAELLMYLSNLHSCIYCLSRLDRWNDAVPLAEELSRTRDRTLGTAHVSSIDSKRWWVWACRQTGDYTTASNLEIQLADALHNSGDVGGAERAIATAVYYENQASASAGDATQTVVDRVDSAENSEKLKSIAKKVGTGALAAGVTAAFEGIVGGLFG